METFVLNDYPASVLSWFEDIWGNNGEPLVDSDWKVLKVVLIFLSKDYPAGKHSGVIDHLLVDEQMLTFNGC